MNEKLVEFILSPETGGVTLILRPQLPFVPDGIRIRESCVELYSGQAMIRLVAGEDEIEEIRAVGGLLLVERPAQGLGVSRETELML